MSSRHGKIALVVAGTLTAGMLGLAAPSLADGGKPVRCPSAAPASVACAVLRVGVNPSPSSGATPSPTALPLPVVGGQASPVVIPRRINAGL